GFTKETLRDHRYFTVDSGAELEQKWPSVLRKRPDFIKVLLWASDEHSKRAISPDKIGERALDPALLPLILQKARAAGLRVSAHVTTAEDFHIAVAAGVDEINHLPYLGSEPIAESDARLAAEKKIVVVTTAGLIERLPKNVMTEAELADVRKAQIINLKRLHESGVRLAIGSDSTSDTSVKEAFYLDALGIFDRATLLKMWTETTAQAIFPDRKIGQLAEGYEANFIAQEADPLKDINNVRRIKYRVKAGNVLEPVGP
ncbi:MAG TPA: amidohydrolase family protein, partial [Pyrinomonadaceae bacterium]|nr:amidohydrolase family protein [Pyrinomonadaceae bacterium]